MGECEYKPLSFWSFNGDMNDCDIENQIISFKEQGLGGFFMHARAGLEIEYFGPKWFAACEKAIETAIQQEMEVWLYDEDGWPSGFGGGRVCGLGIEYQAKKLCCAKGALPDNATVLAAFSIGEGGMPVRIPTDSATDSDMLVGFVVLPNYTDLLDFNVTSRFIEIIYDKYKQCFGEYFGKVIKGIFTDEPQLVEGAPYSFVMEKEYKLRYNRDFIDDLGLLFIDSELGNACRYRYWKMVSELFVSSYTEQISKWCDQNGLVLTGHFAGEDGLCDQVAKSGDLLSHYSYMQCPGVDHLGNRLITAVALKPLGDVAELCGRKMVLSESFGCSGWDVSFADLDRIAAWQRMFGVNRTTVHLSAFSLEGRRKRDYPATFSHHELWWEKFGLLAKKIEEDSAYAMAGENIDDILLLQPLAGMWSALAPGSFSEQARDISSQFRVAVENLLDAQIRFSVVNDALLNRFNNENGILSFGKHRYKTVMVSQTPVLSYETFKLLEKFSDEGGRVIFLNSRPFCINGDISRKIEGEFGEILVSRRAMLAKYAVSNGLYNRIVVTDPISQQCAQDLVIRVRCVDGEYIVYVMQPQLNAERKLILEIEGNRDIFLLNGNAEQLTATQYYAGKSHAEFEISYGEQLIFKTAAHKLPAADICLPFCERRLKLVLCGLENDNYLNIDRAVFTLNGEKRVSENLILENEKIFDTVFKNGADTEIEAEYIFYADFKHGIPKKLLLIAETKKIESVCINGAEITSAVCGYKIDKAFCVYDIADFTVNGRNQILLKAVIKNDSFDGETADGKFESERNRFIYPIEFESVYITGSFDVSVCGEVENCRSFYSVQACGEKSFVLTDFTAKHSGELTAQNLWFYAGNAVFDTKIDYNGERKAVLCSRDGLFPFAEVFVNGKFAGGFVAYSKKIDITKYLSVGSNDVKLIVYGHYRNLLGPHHHKKGKVQFVGPNTFAGCNGFEDFVNPEITEAVTWTDSYSFVPFGPGELYVQYYEGRKTD
ncbi:MAG: hypothetical protein IKD04_06635 [Clostridia bacterium]|nr:hypothetical protein [Clostridia bacterium]